VGGPGAGLWHVRCRASTADGAERRAGARARLVWATAVFAPCLLVLLLHCLLADDALGAPDQTVEMRLEAELTGKVHAGSDTWLTAGFDQLSANPALAWSSVSFVQGAAARSTQSSCSWHEGALTLSVADVMLIELHGRNAVTQETVQLAVAVAGAMTEALNVHFTCLDSHRLHAVEFDSVLRNSAGQAGAKQVLVELDLTWTASL
jgi:hypothetical protein